jgi:antirestriction protein ArdC
MPRGEFQPRHHERQQEDRVKQALQTLEQGIDAILTEESFASYLRTMARLPQYSAGNLALIYAPYPTATRVAGYRKWQELGRQVKKGEKGITILVPHKWKVPAETEEDEERVLVRGFGTGTVFDIAATDGPPLPEPPPVEPIAGASDVGMRLFADLLDYLETEGVPVSREVLPRGNGYWEPSSRRIALGLHVEGDQQTKTLAHETAHFVADHHLDMAKEDVETVAESAAFVVLQHYGIDSSGYSFGYVARWARDRQVLKRNLDAIQRTAHKIIEGIEGCPISDRNSGVGTETTG